MAMPPRRWGSCPFPARSGLHKELPRCCRHLGHRTCKDCVSSFAKSGGSLATKDLSWAPGSCRGAQPPAQHWPQLRRVKHRCEGLEDTELAGHAVLLPVRSLLPGQREHRGHVGDCAYSEPRAGWPSQSVFYLGFFLAGYLGAVAHHAAGCGTFQHPWWHRGRCPGHVPAEVITARRLRIHQQFEGFFLHCMPKIAGYCQSALIRSCSCTAPRQWVCFCGGMSLFPIPERLDLARVRAVLRWLCTPRMDIKRRNKNTTARRISHPTFLLK